MQSIPTKFIGVLTLGIASLIACNSPSGELSAEEQVSTEGQSEAASDTSKLLKFTNGLRAIYQDDSGSYWFGSHNEGLSMFDGFQMHYFTTEDGLSDMQVRTIYPDQQGGLWFECGYGISRYFQGRIETIEKRDYSQMDQWSSSPGDLWFKGNESINYNSMEQGPGVYRYDGTQLVYQRFPSIDGPVDGFSLSISTPVVKASDGTTWFGMYSAVVGYKEGEFQMITDKLLGLDGSKGNLHVRALFEDSRGNLWIGNNNIGLIRYDGNDFEYVSRAHGLVAADSHYNGDRSPAGTLEHVFSISEDVDGNLWFGDRDTGVWMFDGIKFTNYTEKDGLTSSHIWQIYNDREGNLLFAMGDGAVCRWTGEGFVREF